MVNQSFTRWRAQDLEMMRSFYRSSILHLYDSVQMLSEGQKTIAKRDFIFFEFVSVVKGDERSLANNKALINYNVLYYTIQDGQTMLFSFVCPQRLRPQWEGLVPAMMQSIRIK
ncbi:MAG: hypothetical protein HC842_09180 [Cytophagales bacterium]|nr:hypothetical protein [Cytophagales bacterium]